VGSQPLLYLLLFRSGPLIGISHVPAEAKPVSIQLFVGHHTGTERREWARRPQRSIGHLIGLCLRCAARAWWSLLV
jgi:hypothetical protein